MARQEAIELEEEESAYRWPPCPRSNPRATNHPRRRQTPDGPARSLSPLPNYSTLITWRVLWGWNPRPFIRSIFVCAHVLLPRRIP